MEAYDSDKEGDPLPAEWIRTGLCEYSVADTWKREWKYRENAVVQYLEVVKEVVKL
jgi:hypothetical protein